MLVQSRRLSILALVALSALQATAAPNPNMFRRSKVADARFGTGERQQLLQKAYGIADAIDSEIYGQEIAAQLVQDRLTQYLENFGNRKGEPIGLNLIGLPGIGKSAIVKKLMAEGFPIIHLDAQMFAGSKEISNDFGTVVAQRVMPYALEKKPVILIVEELDKVPEITPGSKKEESSALIGQLNQILSDGMVSQRWGAPVDVSNIMVMTTMNFAPTEIESFSTEALGDQKSYYDFTIEDFAKFDSWIRNQPSARFKILSRIFRSNTVSRLGENTVIMQPLGSDEYKAIADLMVKRAVKRATTGENAAKRLQIEIDPSTVEFLAKETTFAPSGARATVQKSDALIEQLINFGMKANDPHGDSSIDRPRRIKIAIDGATKEARLTITPLIFRSPNLVDGKSFEIPVKYEPGSRQFLAPRGLLATLKPTYVSKDAIKPEDKPVTKKEVFETRFPKVQSKTEGLGEAIGERLFGQEEAISIIKDDFDRYLSRKGPAKEEPSLRVLSGFPGIGKSEIVKITAQNLGLPVAKINMQQFSSDSADTIKSFLTTLSATIDEAKGKAKDGRYILLLEELDKTFEINPQGAVVNRPIMALVKDLMNEGVTRGEGKYNDITIDVRNAFTFVTMNFSVDRFGFTADPRLTTIDDVIRAWKSLKTTPMSIKKVLGAMFLPETVNRLMARFTIMKPVDRAAYLKLIDAQVKYVIDERMLDQHGRNVGQIEVKLTPAYRKYLFSEAVIPSEGARNTVVDTQKMISRDLGMAIDKLPRSSRFAKSSLVLTLDFNEANSEVRGSVQLANDLTEKPTRIFNAPIALKFPSPKLIGAIPENRMRVSAHEFGHAFVASILGLRIETVVVVPPSSEMGGYVKFVGASTAQEMMADVYATVASRALERMTLSQNPLDPSSQLDITAGPSGDIQQASIMLYNMLYELGFDPNGGTVDRNFIKGPAKYAAFQEMPPETAEKFGLILRDMENFVLEDLLARHDRAWYVDKIVKLARAGAMNEKEFYSLTGYQHPGNSRNSFGSVTSLRKIFGRYMEKPDAAETAARKARQGNMNQTVEDVMKTYVAKFADSVRSRLHPEIAKPATPTVSVTTAARKADATESGSKALVCQDLFH